MAMTMWAICATRQSKTSLREPKAMQETETFCRRNDQNKYRYSTELEAQARVTPEVAPAFPQVEKPSLEVSTEPVPFETVKQADPTLAKGQTKVLTAGQNGSVPY